uniref:SFRICE_035690 n=1 Tax=Spodoptera frugiperda TaxID=7108 RepID=A0A2H1VK54_SPOFR
MLLAYSRNVLTRNSTSFKPCKRLIFMSSFSRHTTRPSEFLVKTLRETKDPLGLIAKISKNK